MNYNVETIKITDYVTRARVTITNDENVTVHTGEIDICTSSENNAIDYALNTFLPDLRINNPHTLASLVLPIDIVPDPIVEPPAEPEGGV